MWKGKIVHWTTDLRIAEAYIWKAFGQMKMLAELAWGISEKKLRKFKIMLRSTVVLGKQILDVNQLSRIVDNMDYTLTNQAF